MGDELRFEVLGLLRAWRGSEQIQLGPPQQRAFLAVLLLNHGHSVSISRLVDAVWEAPPKGATSVLRVYASQLRKAFDPDRKRLPGDRVIESSGNGYVIRAGSVDLAEFEDLVRSARVAKAGGEIVTAREHLGAALALWQGEPMLGLPGPFVAARRSALAEQRLSAVELRLEIDLDLGHHADLVAELTTLIAENPYSERMRGLLIRALHRSGRRQDALRAFDATRRMLADNLGLSPSAELLAIHQQVLAIEPPEASIGSDGYSVRPAQLPVSDPNFIGRDAFVAQLLMALAVGDNVIVNVTGVGGVGKSTLAVHIAHRAKPLYPDGQLYANLGGTTGTVDPGRVLAGFLRALNVPGAAIPAENAEKAALFRSVVADKRLLVLLDDVATADQVRLLLPGAPSSSVIVTSRHALNELPSSLRMVLPVMSADEARELLTSMTFRPTTGAEYAAAQAIVDACGRLPLAIGISASRVTARSGWSLVTLAARVADDHGLLRELRTGAISVESTIGDRYGVLNPLQAKAFRHLALPGFSYLTVPVVAVMLQVDEVVADDICESLVDQWLLESERPGRYRYDALAGAFARELAGRTDRTEVREEALNRVLGHYRAAAEHAFSSLVTSTLFLPPDRSGHSGRKFIDKRQAAGWLESELANYCALIELAARTPGSELPIDMMLAVAPAASLCQRSNGLVDAARVVAEAALVYGDATVTAKAQLALCAILWFRGDHAEANEYAERVIHSTTALPNRSLAAYALLYAGGYAMQTGAYHQAAEHFSAAVQLFEADNRACSAVAYIAAAHAFSADHRLRDAAVAARRASVIARTLGYSPQCAFLLIEVASVLIVPGSSLAAEVAPRRQADCVV